MLNLRLKDIADKENLYIDGNVPIRKLIELMNVNRKGVVVVLDENKPVGILTERDVVAMLYNGVNLDERVDRHSRKALVTTRGDRTVNYALSLTLDNKIRRVIVTDESNNFLGLITQQDLLKYVEEDFYRLTIKVKHILKEIRDLITVSPEDPLNKVLKEMVTNKISAVAVTRDNNAIGIISEKDILQLACRNVSLENSVAQYMTSPVDTAFLDTPLVEIVEVMNYKNIRRVLIVDREGVAISIITIRDVISNLEGDYSKFLERKLKNAKEILNLLPEMLIEVADIGTEQLIVWANDKVIGKFGKSIIDKPVTDFLPRESWEKIYSTLSKVNKVENIKFKKDNQIYELSGFFLQTDGIIESGRFQLIIRDITEEVRLSTVDPLTNIYNKRFVNGFLMKEIERSRRLNTQFSIVICDLDDFKMINDNFGHMSGDMALKAFTGLITETIRNLDVVGRYGGDEFMIILPEASAEEAYGIIERLKRRIEEMEISVLKGGKIKLTASFGIATFPHDGTSSDDLLIASDDRLYKSKSGGKNTIFCS